LLRLFAAAEGQDLRELWMCDADEDEDGDAFAAAASDRVAIGRIEVFMME